MPHLPPEALDIWNHHVGPAILSTVDPDGQPNTVYVGQVRFEGDRFLIADVHFDKTRRNIAAGSTGSLLFITEDTRACQVKGTLTTLTSGADYDRVRYWLNDKHDLHAAVALSIDTVYRGADKLTTHPN